MGQSNSVINRHDENNGIIESLRIYEKMSFYTLKQDRMIDLEPNILIGICGQKKADDKTNPFAIQCLRLNNENKLHSLKLYQKTDQSLCYEFENDIRLCFLKQLNGKIMYNLKTPQTNLTKEMDEIFVNNFKPLHLASNEFDLINEFIKGTKV
jgi:hypothetical protein